MRKIYLISLFIISSLFSFSQDSVSKIKIDTSTVSDADEIPQFPGGDSLFYKYICDNFNFAKAFGEGDLILTDINAMFKISDSGEIGNVKIPKKGNNQVDQELIRVLKSMPTWKPAIKDGKPVNFLFFIWVSISNDNLEKQDSLKKNQYGFRHIIRKYKYNVSYRIINMSYMNHIKSKENALYNSGVKKVQEKNYQGAIDDFTEALKFNQEDIDALYNRALMKLQLNDRIGACNDWSLIKKLGKNDADEYIKKYCE